MSAMDEINILKFFYRFFLIYYCIFHYEASN